MPTQTTLSDWGERERRETDARCCYSKHGNDERAHKDRAREMKRLDVQSWEREREKRDKTTWPKTMMHPLVLLPLTQNHASGREIFWAMPFSGLVLFQASVSIFSSCYSSSQNIPPRQFRNKSSSNPGKDPLSTLRNIIKLFRRISLFVLLCERSFLFLFFVKTNNGGIIFAF